MSKMVSKWIAALMLGMFIATSGFTSSIALAEQTNSQQEEEIKIKKGEKQAPSTGSDNQSNEHSGHH